MSKRSLFSGIAASLFIGLAMAACVDTAPPADGVFEIVDGERYVFQGAADPASLSPGEMAQYRDDLAYVQSIAPPGREVVLNHADERQHRFVKRRMKLAGKTHQNSPELFARIDELRIEHLAKGGKQGQVFQAESAVTNTRRSRHEIPRLKLNDTQTSLETVSIGSSVESVYYAYVDVGVWDKNGTPVGPMYYKEVYSNMPYEHLKTTGNLGLSNLNEFEGDSLLARDTVQNGYIETYIHLTQQRGPRINVQENEINAPKDKTGDGCISICLNRTWTNDCDYDLTGTPQALKIPLNGQVSLQSLGYEFDQAMIAAFANGSVNADQSGRIYVVLNNVGGGCDANSLGQLTSPMRTFWQRVSLSADKTVLSWDMTDAYAALFDQSCRQVQNNVDLNMTVHLPWLTKGPNPVPGHYTLTLSNNAAVTGPEFKCIKITNSCLAAGTMIEMAGGEATPVESINVGQAVYNPFDRTDSALTVADVAKGFELVPMVRIEDEKGRSLLMTEMHPIHLEGRGMVMAKYLRDGDVATTKDGPSRIVRISREKYDGTVHNLKVGQGAELSALGTDQTTVYANGFLVGDGQIQAKYESIELASQAHPMGNIRLPSRWRQDYLNSARR